MSEPGADAYARRLAGAVRGRLAASGDPRRAAGMRAYLKSDLPCYGVRVPEQRVIVRAAARADPPPDRGAWMAAVRTLWDDASHREERQAAITLTGVAAARSWQDPATLDLYHYLISTGAWWDLVDEVATHRVGPLLRAWPQQVRPAVLDWAGGDDLWVRRAAVICQVGAGPDLDRDLLEAVVRATMGDRSFWLRKGIGWALRDAARADPDWVRRTLADLGEQLSPLSRREASRHL